jgi:putative membrane protein
MGDPQQLVKKLDAVAWVVSAVVLLAVIAMRQIKIETSFDFSFLPPLHAALNALAFVCLLFAFRAIKSKNIIRHKQWMTTALLLSTLFLISYVVYHTTTPETKFGGEGWIRYVYFALLISHVILAAGLLPFILFTYIRGFTGLVERHKKLARWVFPIWLYVTLTGPLCYLMLKPYYG